MTLPDDALPGGVSRRTLMKTALLLAGGLGLNSLSRLAGSAIAAPLDQRSYAATASVLELNGQIVDFLKSAEGGFPRGEIVSTQIGSQAIVSKHLVAVRYSEIVLECQPELPGPLLSSVSAMTMLMPPRLNGTIITADMNRKELARLQFVNALIREVTIPACDASAKDAGYLTVKLQPESTTFLAGRGNSVSLPLAKQKSWNPTNFRLQIQGLEQACTAVRRIEPLTITPKVFEAATGDSRHMEYQSGPLEFSHLVFYLPESQAGPIYQWFDDFVVKGNNDQNRERPGFLELLSPDRSSVVLRLDFSHLGIFGFTPIRQGTMASLVKVEMYCEQMTIGSGKMASTQSAPPPAPATAPAPSGTQAAPPTLQKQTLPQGQPLPGTMQKPLVRP